MQMPRWAFEREAAVADIRHKERGQKRDYIGIERRGDPEPDDRQANREMGGGGDHADETEGDQAGQRHPAF